MPNFTLQALGKLSYSHLYEAQKSEELHHSSLCVRASQTVAHLNGTLLHPGQGLKASQHQAAGAPSPMTAPGLVVGSAAAALAGHIRDLGASRSKSIMVLQSSYFHSCSCFEKVVKK